MKKYMLKALWKSITGEKNTIIAIWKIVYTAVGCTSSVFTFSVLLDDLANYDKLKTVFQNHWVLLIVLGIILAFIINREKLSCSGSRDNDDLIITVKISNLFYASATSYVIPTNSFFRTNMEEEYISPNSVQGAFQNKYFKNNLEALNKKIMNNLAEQGAIGVDSHDKFGNVKKYPLGTVAKVDHKNKHFYFVAINDVNEYGKPINQNFSNVDKAFSGLFDAINKFGHYDDLAMPLIGTGKAAIKEATIDKVVQETIDRFLNTSDKISRNLIICLSPKDYTDGKVNMKKVDNYLDYRCKFEK